MNTVKTLGTAMLILLMGVFSGCASVSYDYGKSGDLQIETHNSRKGTLHNVQITQIGNETLVSGIISRAEAARILKGFVKVDIVNAKGLRVDTAETKYMFRHSGPRIATSGSFEAKLSAPPPKGAKAVLHSHDTRDKMGEDTKGSLSIL